MSSFILSHAAGKSPALDDHPLLEAARVALAADPRPRMIKFRVIDGSPIEIPDTEPPIQEQE